MYTLDVEGTSLEYKPVISPNGRECEKNWALINGSNKVIYKWHPLVVGQIVDDEVSDHLKFNILDVKSTPLFFKNLRGSTNGFLFGEEIWFICHVVDYDKPRFYYHCFVVLDKQTLQILRWSNLFTFEGQKIEYTLGLIVEETRILISYSTWNKTANLGIYNKQDVENTLIIHKP